MVCGGAEFKAPQHNETGGWPIVQRLMRFDGSDFSNHIAGVSDTIGEAFKSTVKTYS